MKRILLAIVVLIASFTTLAPAAPPQPQGTPGAQAPQGPAPAGFYKKVQGLLAQLNLTADQQKKINQIMQDSKARNAERKAVIHSINPVLTPGQQQKFHTLLDEMRQQNQGH